ncbi:MAG: metal-dependent hydrolase [Methylomicrobium sp.]
MANFNTHVTGAALGGAAVSALAVNAGLFDQVEAASYALMTVIGGILPDIDADCSRPAKLLFFLLGVSGSVAFFLASEPYLPARYLAIGALLVFLTIRYPIFTVFQKMTTHRGVFHSVLSAVFFGLLTTCAGYYFLAWHKLEAWLYGSFLSLGFMIHLCLDELFSVDLANSRIKKSFGSALKLFSCNNKKASALLLILTILLFIAAPPSAQLLEVWGRFRACFTNC